MKKSVVKITTSLLLVAMLAAPLFQTASAAADQDYDRDVVRVPPERGESTSASSTTTSGSSFKTSTKYKYSKIQSRIEEYRQTSKDVKGWLTIPNTNINEPIVYNNKDANKWYLYRTWDGTNYPNTTYKNYKTTATFADYRHVWGETWKKSSKNTVLYGHNWTNLRTPLAIGNVSKHTMFGQLPSYTDLQFAKDNPYIYYSTGENEGIWKVFSVAYCELDTKFFYNNPNPSKEAYQTLLNEWKDRTQLDFDVDVTTSDRILTLSTCTRQYEKGPQQRFVVVARLLREGESEKDTVKVSVNKDAKKPQF